MGQRFRLRRDFPLDGLPSDVQVILQALKTYGMVLADRGQPWFLSGEADSRLSSATLAKVSAVHGSDFEAVDSAGLMLDASSGQVRGSTVVQGRATVRPPIRVALNGVTVNTKTPISGGMAVSSNRVTLTAPAPASGVTVWLGSSNPAVLSIAPSEVHVAEGAAEGSFGMSTTKVKVSTPVTISATYAGLTRLVTVTVRP